MKKLLILLLSISMLLAAVPAFAADAPTSVRPSGICVAEDGGYVITDVFNKQVLKGSGNSWTVIAGKVAAAGASGEPRGIYLDGKAEDAYFMLPWDIVEFMDGYAISDTDANVVRYLADGKVQTLITVSGGLSRPTGLATDGERLFVADTNNDRVVVMEKDGSLKVYVTGVSGPTGLSWYDGTLYICETEKNRIVCVKDGKVSLVAGKAIADGDEYAGGYVNGSTGKAQFDHPTGVLAAEGVIYISDNGNMAIRQIKDGVVTTLSDADNVNYRISDPRGLALSGSTLYVADVFYPYPVGLVTTARTFTDVKSEDAPAVSKAVNYGLINGFADGSFKPDASVTRAQFVTMLSRAQTCIDGQTVIDGDSVYADITGTEWHAKAINWATAAGYMYGRVNAEGKRIADPNSVLKASEIDHFMTRFTDALGVEYEKIAGDAPAAPVSRLTAAKLLSEALEKAGY